MTEGSETPARPGDEARTHEESEQVAEAGGAGTEGGDALRSHSEDPAEGADGDEGGDVAREHSEAPPTG